MTKRQITVSAIILVAIISFQFTWHSMLAYSNPQKNCFLKIYLSYNPATGKGVAGLFDLMLPAIVFGVCFGFVGWRWTAVQLTGGVVIGAGVLVGSLVLDVMLMRNFALWWWPASTSNQIAYLALKWLQAGAVTGAFVYAARLVQAYRKVPV